MYTVPILLIIYNRSQEILQQIASLKKIQAQEIYIYADGPKESEIDKVNCNKARSTLLNLIDWECKIITFFNDKNSGCGRGPYTAINWFFENVEEGIILEDDCIPNLSFFSFCRELLVKYKHDTRVWQISGTNRLGTYFDETDYSYIFSNYSSEWGWATWKRAWQQIDYKIKLWDKEIIKRNLKSIYYQENWYKGISSIFNDTYNNNEKISWWDYQWLFIKNINNGLSIIPKQNLISNIGFGEKATHTKELNNQFMRLETEDIKSALIHPENIMADYFYDYLILNAHFPIQESKYKIIRIMKRWIQRLFQYLTNK